MSLISFLNSLLSMQGPVAETGASICQIVGTHLRVEGIQLWLFSKTSQEFSLIGEWLSNSTVIDPRCSANRMPITSSLGESLHARGPSKYNIEKFFQNESPRRDIKSGPSRVTCIPATSIAPQEDNLPFVLVIYHSQPLAKVSAEELMFFGNVVSWCMSRSQSVTRRQTVLMLNKIALELVSPADEMSFAERKQHYLKSLISILLKSTHASAASIFTANEANDAITCVASTGLANVTDVSKVVYHANEGVTWHVFETNAILNANNVRQHDKYKGKSHEIRRISPTSEADPFLALPLLGQGARVAIGVIRLLERRCFVRPGHLQNFSDLDVDSASIIAAQVSPVFQLLALHDHRERFIMRTVHQVIQPLSGVVAHSSNLVDGAYDFLDIDEFVSSKIRYIQAMASSCIRMMRNAAWVAASKDFAFLQHVDKTSKRLSEYLIQRIINVQPIRKEEHIYVELVSEREVDKLGKFLVDEIYFDQVLHNILHNAVKYSYPMTTVKVCAARREHALVVTVSSIGIPILPQERERIFWDRERGFYAEHYDPHGTGQGLYISQKIIRGLGGRILLGPSQECPEVPIPKKDYPIAQQHEFILELHNAFV